MKVIGHLINGKLSASDDSAQHPRLQDLTNPSTNEIIGKVALASKATVEEAISAAEAAYPAWRNLPTAKRVRIMYRLRDLLEENAEKICELITLEHGKVLNDAMGELQRGIENIEYVCSAPEMLKGEHSKNVGPAIDSWSEFQPLGVCAGITPFNFPAMVPLWMWPMAIACGNTFILKPSERTPSCALFIAELGIEAGIPAGVLNIVNGDKEAVDTLLTDKRIQAVSFVGSTPIAEYVYTTGTAHGKRVQAFGGAKNHAIIMPDADLDNAVAALMGAAYGSCGERCMAISVAVAVGDETANTLVAKLKEQIAQLKIGDGMNNQNDMGPLVTQAHLNKVEGLISAGIEEGAELVVDGRNMKVPGYERGNYLGACLFDRVSEEMAIHRSEIFGPVLCVMRVDTMQEAMNIIDAHEYGNGTCLFTRDGEAARYFSDNIKVGMVGINVPLPVPVAHHSFGGWKRSLFGDLHAYGPDSVRFYTKRKTITQRWPASGVREGAQYSFPSNG
ncbi:CoA-acylating methylmalonate-semialdehyde dehydrogenase [Microbulbifer variabilis]|uniref:methylmalonate-semialdehyde dehydrogenase (CoA acylating) n=1 Tax=Microbulbifer variabilis TaxID=266805 RepID=A0ABY4VF55_9GAMM|nr:CoA-acylating methylmalonate-semialdehyde dehydrogenase [Microbulbifer variabilis]USD22912.1 CoA-acylating methylmalonate-semialdehyde dehydrogenase [Microbulbifer variabilis]